VVPPGPQLLIPFEVNAAIGWLRLSAEAGYWFCSKDIPNSWIRGVVAGHEFRKDTELYVELYDQRNVQATGAGTGRLRETTLGIGGRVPVVKGQWLRLIGMVGHGLVTPTFSNGQPTWIASVGLQYLSDRRRRHSDE
jgi:hypothetical protein